jgi:hypothetical protein
MRQPEASADDPTIPECTFDFVRHCGRPDVKIFRAASKKEVAYTSADQIGGMPELLKSIHDFQRVRVDIASGERMLGTW